MVKWIENQKKNFSRVWWEEKFERRVGSEKEVLKLVCETFIIQINQIHLLDLLSNSILSSAWKNIRSTVTCPILDVIKFWKKNIWV